VLTFDVRRCWTKVRHGPVGEVVAKQPDLVVVKPIGDPEHPPTGVVKAGQSGAGISLEVDSVAGTNFDQDADVVFNPSKPGCSADRFG
jgi:hypothetical protein